MGVGVRGVAVVVECEGHGLSGASRGKRQGWRAARGPPAMNV